MSSGEPEPIFMSVGDTVRNPGRSGIQTVVRSLAAAFGGMGAPVRPVVWNAGLEHLHPLPPELSLGLGAEPLRDPTGTFPLTLLGQPAVWPWWLLERGNLSRLSIHHHPLHRRAPQGSWVLLPELMYAGRAKNLVDYVHRQGWRLAVIFHDAIPVQAPEYVPLELPAQHAEYMRAFSKADLILPNSEASAQGWREFMALEGLTGPPVRTITLACDIPGVPRATSETIAARERAKQLLGDDGPDKPVRLLCVSTLEPRKNHRALLAAFELAVARRPDLPLELDLAGAPYIGARDIMESVHQTMNRLPGRVRWREKVEHSLLCKLYEQADFTVYPSVLEGFGLPVIESLWFGCPCICANFGVMAENAIGGGCQTVDVRKPEALADAIIELAASPERRRKLTAEATSRKLKTWHDYAAEVLVALAEVGKKDNNGTSSR
jgi:glycosyltransferase involved in cell wall biosynthesis